MIHEVREVSSGCRAALGTRQWITYIWLCVFHITVVVPKFWSKEDLTRDNNTIINPPVENRPDWITLSSVVVMCWTKTERNNNPLTDIVHLHWAHVSGGNKSAECSSICEALLFIQWGDITVQKSLIHQFSQHQFACLSTQNVQRPAVPSPG